MVSFKSIKIAWRLNQLCHFSTKFEFVFDKKKMIMMFLRFTKLNYRVYTYNSHIINIILASVTLESMNSINLKRFILQLSTIIHTRKKTKRRSFLLANMSTPSFSLYVFWNPSPKSHLSVMVIRQIVFTILVINLSPA